MGQARVLVADALSRTWSWSPDGQQKRPCACDGRISGEAPLAGSEARARRGMASKSPRADVKGHSADSVRDQLVADWLWQVRRSGTTNKNERRRRSPGSSDRLGGISPLSAGAAAALFTAVKTIRTTGPRT